MRAQNVLLVRTKFKFVRTFCSIICWMFTFNIFTGRGVDRIRYLKSKHDLFLTRATWLLCLKVHLFSSDGEFCHSFMFLTANRYGSNWAAPSETVVDGVTRRWSKTCHHHQLLRFKKVDALFYLDANIKDTWGSYVDTVHLFSNVRK